MLKRLFDIIASALGLIILSPIIVIVAWQVKKKLGSPILFRQVRPGLNGKPFEMIKFRTMTDECDDNGRLLPDAERLTTFGRFLRSSSLDELPELWNVFKGDMSIVGPRPLLMSYMKYFSTEEMQRHNVRPGITGLAQVNGRNMIGWDSRLALDVKYVKEHNLILDVKIIFRTIWQVIKRQDIVLDMSTTTKRGFIEERRSRND